MNKLYRKVHHCALHYFVHRTGSAILIYHFVIRTRVKSVTLKEQNVQKVAFFGYYVTNISNYKHSNTQYEKSVKEKCNAVMWLIAIF